MPQTSTSSSSATFAGLSTSGSGGITGAINTRALTYTSSGAINRAYSMHILDSTSSSVTVTIDAPVVGEIHVFTCTDATTSAQVVLTAGTWDGTNASATFDAAAETLVVTGIATDRYAIVENIGTVGLA